MRLIASVGPKGFQLHRYWWTGGAAVYIAEMDRTAENLQFDVELANNKILGRENHYECYATAPCAKKMLPLAGVNGSFGIREDSYGRGGMIFNLHIQNGELVSIPISLDRWGYSPPSPWGEDQFWCNPRRRVFCWIGCSSTGNSALTTTPIYFRLTLSTKFVVRRVPLCSLRHASGAGL